MLCLYVGVFATAFLAIDEAAAASKKAPPVDCSTIDIRGKCNAAELNSYALFERNYYCKLAKISDPSLHVKCQAKQAVACAFGWVVAKDNDDPIHITAEVEVPPGMYKIIKGKAFYACHVDEHNKDLVTAEAIDMGASNEEKTKQESTLLKTLTKMWEEE